jgi:hypothetical protein
MSHPAQQAAPAVPAVPASPDAAPAIARQPGRPSAVAVGDNTIPLDQLPHTAQEVRGLRERRSILADQLTRATNRREEMVRQLNQDPRLLPAEARQGVQQRLDLLDQRILQLERDQMQTERLLSNTPADVLGRMQAEDRQQSDRVDQDEATAMVFAAFGFGILLTLVVGRVRRRMARRRAAKLGLAGAAGATSTAVAAAADERIDRLAQAVDAIAEEVERIGEGQRFVTQLLASRPEPVRVEAERR